MATTTLGSGGTNDNQTAASPSSEAFIRAFRTFHDIDNPPHDLSDTPEFRLAMYAFEGGQERVIAKRIENHDEAAVGRASGLRQAAANHRRRLYRSRWPRGGRRPAGGADRRSASPSRPVALS